jgi:hypothetical protein
MSDFVSTLEKTREAFAAAARLEQALRRAPEDPALQMNLRSRRRLAERFQSEFFEAAKQERIDVCQYRLIPNTEGRYPIASVSRSIEKFQTMFSLVYSALRTGPKNTAHIAHAMQQQTALEFGYSFPGSLGLVLTVPGGRDLFSTQFDDSVSMIQRIASISAQNEVVEIGKSMGRAIVNTAYDWSLENYKADFSVDVVWTKSDGKQVGRAIDRQQLGKIVDIIGVTSETTTSALSVLGVLVGIDLPTRWFHFVIPDGDSFKGTLGPDFSTVKKITVNRWYRADLIEHSIIHYATERVQKRYELLRLVPEKTA